MTLINNFEGLQNAPNASGAPWFQVVRPEDVASIPDVILDQISSAITLNGGAYAYNIMATVGTVQWSETTQQVGGRTVYKSVFSFVIPKDRADVLTYAKHLNNRGVIAIVRDANGQNRLMGNASEPATFQLATRTLGQQRGGRNEHRYEIVLSSGKPVPFYEVTTHLPAPANVCPPVPSVELTVYENAGLTTAIIEADFNDTVYLKAVAADITPTAYRFVFECADGIPQLVYEGANDNASFSMVGATGAGRFFVYVTDDNETWYGQDENFTLNAAFYLDLTAVVPKYAVSVSRYLKGSFIGNNVVLVRRSSDNAQLGFTIDEITDGTLETWVGAGNDGFVVTLYDQSGNGNDRTISNSAYQYYLVVSGALSTDSNGNAKMVSKASTSQNPFPNTAFSLASSAASFTMVSQKFRGASYSRYWAVIRQGNSTNLAAGYYALRGDDLTGTPAANSGVGTPTVYVNNSDIGSYNGGDIYTELGNTEAVVEVLNIDFSANSGWLTNYSELVMSNDSEFSEWILWDDDITADRATLNANTNSHYGY